MQIGPTCHQSPFNVTDFLRVYTLSCPKWFNSIKHQATPPLQAGWPHQAERVGFEPTVTTCATTVFETAPFNHSGTSPV